MPKGITITLNNKDYLLRYDLNALAYLEEKTGMSITKMNNDIGARTILYGIHAGMKHIKGHPTVEQVGSWIDDGDIFFYAAEVFGRAIAESLGKKEDIPKEAEDPNEAQSQ